MCDIDICTLENVDVPLSQRLWQSQSVQHFLQSTPSYTKYMGRASSISMFSNVWCLTEVKGQGLIFKLYMTKTKTKKSLFNLDNIFNNLLIFNTVQTKTNNKKT